EGGQGLEEALLECVSNVGAKLSFQIGWYHHLTKDRAVHGPSLARDPALVGPRRGSGTSPG
ncbi:unnamed protein product, partial [Prorocentrum cordatum]